MSDYLTHLSTRLSGSDNGIIQPRLPARFEPSVAAEPSTDVGPVSTTSEFVVESTMPNREPAEPQISSHDLPLQSEQNDKRPVQRRISRIADSMPDSDDASTRAQHVSQQPSAPISDEHIQPPLTQRQDRVSSHPLEDRGDRETRRAMPIQPVDDAPPVRAADVVHANPLTPATTDMESIELVTPFTQRPSQSLPEPPANGLEMRQDKPSVLPTSEADFRLADQVARTILPAQPDRKAPDDNAKAQWDMPTSPVAPMSEVDFRLAEEIARTILAPRPNRATTGEDTPGETHNRIAAQPADSFQSLRPLEPATPQESAPPVPTINVTISRIEVRATPPSTASSRPARENARLGADLEAYLRQRSGGQHE